MEDSDDDVAKQLAQNRYICPYKIPDRTINVEAMKYLILRIL